MLVIFALAGPCRARARECMHTVRTSILDGSGVHSARNSGGNLGGVGTNAAQFAGMDWGYYGGWATSECAALAARFLGARKCWGA